MDSSHVLLNRFAWQKIVPIRQLNYKVSDILGPKQIQPIVIQVFLKEILHNVILVSN